MVSYFLAIFIFFCLFFPLLNEIRRNDLQKTNALLGVVINIASTLIITLLVTRYFLHTNILIAKNYSLGYFIKVFSLFVIVELILIFGNYFFHLSHLFEVVSIKRASLKTVLRALLLSLLIVLAVFLYKASFWTTNTFGLLNPEQLIYNLKQPMQGANSSFIDSFINGPLVVAVVTLVLVLPANLILFHVHLRVFDYLRHAYLVPVLLSVVFSVFLITLAAKNINAVGFYRYFTTSSAFIQKNYVDPDKVKLVFPTKKRNLIYIYVESLESTSIDKQEGGQMSVNLLPKLTKVSDEGIHFSNTGKKFGGAMQFYGTGWTIAGMVAQTSGLPLKVPVQGNTYANSDKQRFLPGATTLNDILEEEGYHQTILMGSDATFGGRRSYFTQHGNVKIDDWVQAKKDKRIPQDYKVWWGYEDSKLFEYAKEDLIKLSSGNQPFNFTMLTANTHHIGGFPEKNMPHKYSNQYSNVISFTDTQLTEFLTWIKAQKFYHNTTIIINGDHLSMDAKYYQNISSKKRHTFNLILNAPKNETNGIKTKNRIFGTYDMFPTTLAAIGVKIEGNRLGLGTNLLSGKKTIAERYGFNKVNDQLSQSSRFYNDTFMYGK